MKSPQQQESFPKHVLEQFNGDCCPSEVPQQRILSPVVPSLSYDILRSTTKESGGTSNEDELEHRFPKSHVDMISQKLEPTMDSAKSYATELTQICHRRIWRLSY